MFDRKDPLTRQPYFNTGAAEMLPMDPDDDDDENTPAKTPRMIRA